MLLLLFFLLFITPEGSHIKTHTHTTNTNTMRNKAVNKHKEIINNNYKSKRSHTLVVVKINPYLTVLLSFCSKLNAAGPIVLTYL